MKRSESRILTTHTGSLPRSPALRDLLVRLDRGEAVDAAALAREAEAAVRHVVARQLEAGIDVGNDGEQPRVGFSTYPARRMRGFGGASTRRMARDIAEHPDYASRLSRLRAGAARRSRSPAPVLGQLRRAAHARRAAGAAAADRLSRKGRRALAAAREPAPPARAEGVPPPPAARRHAVRARRRRLHDERRRASGGRRRSHRRRRRGDRRPHARARRRGLWLRHLRGLAARRGERGVDEAARPPRGRRSRHQATLEVRRGPMARLTPITSKAQVAEKDHAIVEGIVKSRGALQGPFTMFLHSPELAGRLAHLGAFVRFEGSLDMRVRVMAAMTVARELDAVYVWGAQTGQARKLGVPESTIAAIRDRHTRVIPPEA